MLYADSLLIISFNLLSTCILVFPPVYLSSSVFIQIQLVPSIRLCNLSIVFVFVHTMPCLILLHLFACCITLIVVKPLIPEACADINAFIEEYASDDED